MRHRVAVHRRVLLVEFLARGRFFAGIFFPYAKGVLLDRGMPVEWVRVLVPADIMLDPHPDAVAAVVDELLPHLSGGPAAVIFSHCFGDQLVEPLRRALPDARFGLLDGDLSLGVPGATAPEHLQVLSPSPEAVTRFAEGAEPTVAGPVDPAALIAFPRPDYAFTPAGAEVAVLDPLLYVVDLPVCAYRQPLGASRFFADRPELDLPERWGCAFCVTPRWDHASAGRGVDHRALLTGQLAAMAKAHPARRLEIHVAGAHLVADPERLARVAVAQPLAPSRFLLSYRADELVAHQGRLRNAGQILGPSGHRVSVNLIGVESFSARQLDRYHKGCGPETMLGAIRALAELEAAEPEVFASREFQGLSTILYDPWVSLGDVALNLQVARLFQLEDRLGKLLASRLRLAPGLPLAAAAEQAGLLRSAASAAVFRTARRSFYFEETPWAFVDPRLEAVCELTSRLELDEELGDRIADSAARQRLRQWRLDSAEPPVKLALRLVQTALDHDQPLGAEQLLQRAGDLPERRLQADVDEWLASSFEYGAFVHGVKPVLKLERVFSPEQQDRILERLAVDAGAVVVLRREGESPAGRWQEAFVAHDRAVAEGVRDLAERLSTTGAVSRMERADAIRRIGVALGYPDCCATAFAEVASETDGCDAWLWVRRRLESPGVVSAEMSPLYLPYVPCSLECEATRRLTARLQQLRGASRWVTRGAGPLLLFLDATAEVAALEPKGPVEEVELPSARTVTWRYRYRPSAFGLIREDRRRALERGDTVSVEPGLVRVLRDGREIAAFALQAYPWLAERPTHPEFWGRCVEAQAERDRFPDESEPEPRALLVEFINADQFPGRVSVEFPFIQGYLDWAGVPTRWVRFGVATTNLLTHQRDQITLDDEELALLERVTREHRPSLILTTDPLHPPQVERLLECSPGASVRDIQDKDFVGVPGAPPYRGRSDLQRPEYFPGYGWEPGNEAARRRESDNIYLALAVSCGHRLRVATNPLFDGVDDCRVSVHLGCSFCGNWNYTRRRMIAVASLPARTPEAWIAKQIEAIARSRPTPDQHPNAILLEKLESPAIVHQCLELMHEYGLDARVSLLFAARTDQVPTVESLLRDYYALHPDSPLRCGVYASGIESFAAEELGRYNKGTTPLDGLHAVNTFRHLAADLGGAFSFTGLTFVLLTPWTTPENLHLNLGLIRFASLSGSEAGNVMQSRLRLHQDRAITALAERDGLVLDEEPDPVLVMNRRKLFSSERPWRFADERLRPLSRIWARYELLGSELEDELAREILTRIRQIQPTGGPHGDRTVLDLLLCQVDVLRSQADVLDESSLLDRAVALLLDRRARATRPLASTRFRIGEQRHDLAALLERLIPLLGAGQAPALAAPGVLAAEVDERVAALLDQRDLHYGLVEGPVAGGAGTGTLYVARDPEALHRVAAQPELRGVPECCARAHAESAFADVRLPAWAAWYRRLQTPGPIPPELFPLLVPSLGFVPCQPDCGEATARYRAWFETLGLAPDPEAGAQAYVFALDEQRDDDLVRLRVIDADDTSLRYDPSSIAPGDEALRSALRGGNQLRLRPGQIQIRDDERVVDLLTASHGVWYSQRGWHAAEWQELAQTAAYCARAEGGSRVDWALAVTGDDAAQEPRPSGASVERRAPGAASARPEEISAFASRIDRVLAAQADRLAAETGFAVRQVKLNPESARVVLADDTVRLELLIERADQVERAFSRGRTCAISHHPETPPDTPRKLSAIERLLALLEQ